MKTIAVLGAGTMGAGIAQVAAQGGFSVILRDLQMAPVKDGLQIIERNLDKSINCGVLDADEKYRIMSRIHGTTDLAEIKAADLVIESVVENMAVKKQLFAELDNICSEHTVLATNTSTLSITGIASWARRRDKIMGLHFHNPVTSVKLVELIKGMDTSNESIAIAQQFVEQIGKEYILVERESPGFIVNRLLITYLNEAIFVFSEGLADKEAIDKAMKLGTGMTYGPLELADIIGLDIVNAMIVAFYEEFRDSKYRPHPSLSTMVRAGYLGRKSGKGFYNYDNNE